MRNTKFKYNLIASFLCHLLVMLFLYLNLFSYNFNNTPTEIEVAVCGAGDMEKTLGGTGEGNLKEAKPMEDPERTIEQNEIDTETDISEKGVPDQSDKVPEGSNEKLPKHPAEGMTPSDPEQDDDPGEDSRNEAGDSSKDAPEIPENKEPIAEPIKPPVESTPQPKDIEKAVEKESSVEPAREPEPITPEPIKKPEPEPIKEPTKEPAKEPAAADKTKPAKAKPEEAKKKKKKKKRVITDLLNETKKKDKIDSDFDKLLSGFSEKDLGIKKKKRNASSAVKGQGGGSGGTDLTDSDYGMIKRQVIPNWVVPIMVQNADNMIVRLEVKISDDGTVNEVVILDENRYNSDTLYHLAVDSARRAVLLSSPLKIPAGKISKFRDFIIVFNPKDAIR